MIKKLVKRIFGSDEQKKIDPSVFKDPLALKTCWDPILLNGSSNTFAYRLTKVHSSRMEFKVGLLPKLISLIFIFMGLFLTFFTLFYFEPDIPEKIYFYVFSCVALFLFGCFSLYRISTPIVFDKGRRFFWKGRKKPWELIQNKKSIYSAKFDEIHAIQLLPKKIIGKNQSYRFELNIVLKNSNRLHVVDYSGTRAIDTDAKTLSLFLRKPIWSAI